MTDISQSHRGIDRFKNKVRQLNAKRVSLISKKILIGRSKVKGKSSAGYSGRTVEWGGHPLEGPGEGRAKWIITL